MEVYKISEWFAIGAGCTIMGACIGAIIISSNRNKNSIAVGTMLITG